MKPYRVHFEQVNVVIGLEPQVNKQLYVVFAMHHVNVYVVHTKKKYIFCWSISAAGNKVFNVTASDQQLQLTNEN